MGKTPTKNDIIEKAFAIHHSRNRNVGSNNPELEELKEDGSFAEARNELMRSEGSQYLDYVEGEARALGLLEDKIETEKAEPFTIDLSELMQTGLCVSGTSGSGKSYLGFIVADRLMKHDVIVYCIDASQAWEKHSGLPSVIHVTWPMTVEWEDGTAKQSTIFDISRLTYPQRLEFTERFCKTLLDARKNSQHRPPTVVIFEESELYFYQGSMRSPKKYGSSIELVTNGRNFNVRYVAITQFPSMIDKLLIKMCKQRFFGWSNEPNDIDYIEDIIGKEHAKKLEKLETGEFIYSYPVRKGGTKKIKVPHFKSETTPKSLPSYPLVTDKPKQTSPEISESAAILLSATASFIFFLLLVMIR